MPSFRKKQLPAKFALAVLLGTLLVAGVLPSPMSSPSGPPPLGRELTEATDSSASTPLNYAIVLVSSFFTFLAMAIICDEYLCPAIDTICEVQQIPDDIAGATLLAFGSSAPEIFMNLAATIKGQVTLSLPAIFGSAIIAFGFIPPICAFAVPKTMALATWPVLRDSGIYCLALAMTWKYLGDGYIDKKESTNLTLLYFVYLAVLLVPHAIRACRGTASRRSGADDYDDLEESKALTGEAGAEAAAAEEEDEAPGVLGKFMEVCSIPITFIFSYTVPLQPEGAENPSLCKAFVSVGISLVWISALSSLALEVATFAGKVFCLSPTTAGATLLALGAQIPDTFGSLSMAKSGMPGGAVANAVGSQVINASLAVGAPFLMYNLIFGKPIYAGEETGGMQTLLSLLLIVIAMFWAVTFPVLSWASGSANIASCRMDKTGGGLLFAVSAICYAYFVYVQEHP